MDQLVLKGLKLRIYPNKLQAEAIEYNFGANRFVWNNMLEMMIKRHENNPEAPFLNAFALNNILTQFKKENPWLKRAESTSLQVTDHDLIESYKRFFEHTHKFPKFKSKKYPKQSYQSKMVSSNIKLIDKAHIQLPKLGILPFKTGQKIPDVIKNVTVRKSATGKYYAVLVVEQTIKTFEKTNKSLGLDMGVADLLITSDGVKYPTIRFDKELEKKKHFWEKRLARRRILALKDMQYHKKYDLTAPKSIDQYANYMKAKSMVAKVNEKIANKRKDYLHKLTIELVKANDVIVIEDLRTKNLLSNHKLARSIANQAWRELRLMLEYKYSWYGKKLIVVDPYKTSQICSNCGYDDGRHGLAIREWVCPNCQTHLDRDINASKNILKRGLEQALVK